MTLETSEELWGGETRKAVERAEVLAQLYHLGFQVIDLRNLLAQLGELTFISLRSDLQ